MKKFLFTISITFFSLSAYTNDLDDYKNYLNQDLPSTQSQVALYHDAYTPHNHPDFEANTTHVPGFGRILPMAYAYAFNHPDMTEREHGLLDRFWQETVQDFQRQSMTIPRFKKTLLRLGLLMGQAMHHEEKDFFPQLSKTLGSIVHHVQNNQWDLDHFKGYVGEGPLDEPFTIEVAPYPLCFEAILLQPNGELELDDFLRGYLHETTTLSLSALPYNGQGPHGDTLSNPGFFLFHDLTHWASFYHYMGPDLPEYWNLLQKGFSYFYQNGDTSNLQKVGLFFMLHEYPVAMGNMASFDDVEAILYNWIAQMKERVLFQAKSTPSYVDKILKSHMKKCQAGDFSPMYTPIEKDTYNITWILKNIEGRAFSLSLNEFNVVLDAETIPAETPHVDITKIVIKEFKTGPTTRSSIEELVKNGFTDPSDNRHHVMPPHTIESIQRKVTEGFKSQTFPFISQKGHHDLFLKDVAKLINYGYGYEAVEIEATAQEISQAFDTFMDQFLKNSLAALGQ